MNWDLNLGFPLFNLMLWAITHHWFSKKHIIYLLDQFLNWHSHIPLLLYLSSCPSMVASQSDKATTVRVSAEWLHLRDSGWRHYSINTDYILVWRHQILISNWLFVSLLFVEILWVQSRILEAKHIQPIPDADNVFYLLSWFLNTPSCSLAIFH